MTCHLKNGHFEGFGGSSKLEEIIQRFKEWAQQ
ncbi:Imm53 family immunity protein [Butyrivibrio fibrisolvens]